MKLLRKLEWILFQAPNQQGQVDIILVSDTDFDKYIDEISDKFQDSYQLFLASVLGRRKSENMGKEVRGFKADSSNIKFVLVIPTHKFDWLVALNDALKKQLRKTISIWNIEIAVMNEELAREHGLLT